MLEKMLFLVLLLNTTGLFRFIAPQIGSSIGQVSISLLVINILYLLLKADQKIFLRNRKILPWLIFLLVWPLATVSYAPSYDFREIGLQLYFFTLFLGTIVWVHRNGLEGAYRLFVLSLVITVFGMVLSKLAPEYFEGVASLANAGIPGKETMGRPTGFFMQSNRLAFGLIMIFIGWFALWKNKTVFREVLAFVFILFLLLYTGSRAGIMTGFGLVGVYLFHNWRQRLARGRFIYWLGLFISIAFLVLIGTRTYFEHSDNVFTDRKKGDLFDRIESVIYFKINEGGSLKRDGSLQERYISQKYHYKLIMKDPILGYGHGSYSYFYNKNRIFLSAHSQFLTVALQYGIFYPLLFMIFFLSQLKNIFKNKIENYLNSNIVLQFCFVFILLFTYGAILEMRMFYILFGLVTAILWFPDHFCENDTN